MGFFDNLGKKASKAYDATAEKTSKLAKEAKLRMQINENKSDINEIYKQIGKKVYEKHVREENIDIKTELEEECTKIDVLSAEIETNLKAILELKDKRQCENCHTEIDIKDEFCSKCGTKQPKEEVITAEVVEQNLENAEINSENQEEARIVEEEVSGESVPEQDSTETQVEVPAEEPENTIERVTEVMAVETQEEAKQENE